MSEELRVLMIEDSRDDALLVERELNKAGFNPTIRRVDSKPDLLRSLSEWNPDLILSDFTIPGFSGLEALEITQRSHSDVPFIFVSGTIGEERAVEALKHGATDYVVKDRLSRLGTAVNRALREKRERNERRRVEQSLREVEARQRMVLNSFPIAVYSRSCTPPFAPTWVSDNITSLTGFSASTFTSLPDFWRSRIHPESLEEVQNQYKGILSKGRVVMEYRWRDSFDRYRWILDQATAVRDENGNLREVIGTWLDISTQKTLEEQLRQAQKMEAVGRLAGGIAHDFNNLLTAIIGYSDMLLERLQPSNTLRPEISEINVAGKRAAELTRQLLAFSRRQLLQPRVIELNNIISGLEKMLRRLIGEDIELTARLAESLGRIKVDPGQMEQVMMNLVVNARDAMPRGGKITIETSNVRLDHTEPACHGAVPAGSYVMVSIADTGTGMDAETQSHLFEPFFTTKPQGKGTGLGLSTVYGIVRQSDGHIAFTSELEKGTTFKIYFPPVKEAAQPLDRPQTGSLQLRGTETILVVEDDTGVRILTQRILEKMGYTVIVAADGAEALSAVGDLPPIHLVVTDIVMPGMSGPEMVDRLQQIRPRLKVLYLSGYTDATATQLNLIRPGFNFLQKPFTAQGLGYKVREILNASSGEEP